MTDLKKQLEQWQSKQEPSLSEKTPAESLSQPPLKTPAKKKDIDEIEPTELSREDRLLFLETVVQMGGAQEKTKLDNALKEQAASQEKLNRGTLPRVNYFKKRL